MSPKAPVIQRISLIAVMFQFVLIGLIVYGFDSLHWPLPFPTGAILYSATAMILRKSIAGDHRKGIRLVRLNKFAEAIPFFEKSYAFFTKNKNIDKFRFITLLSSSSMTYRELAMTNIAFSYTQIGNGQKAIEVYERVLEEFPDNGVAHTALKMLQSVKEKSVE
ncbi:MAG TPA: tetratricopeptide repeat protein [Bacteroidia bacterium]|nr:tetratricopeptide repeat protein [Bacteroidia bacterium]